MSYGRMVLLSRPLSHKLKKKRINTLGKVTLPTNCEFFFESGFKLYGVYLYNHATIG